MTLIPKLQDNLLELLLNKNFDTIYYDFFYMLVEKRRSIRAYNHFNVSHAIEKIFPGVQYFYKENFYRYKFDFGEDFFWLHIYNHNNMSLEFGFYLVKKSTVVSGGFFHELAFKTAYMRDDCIAKEHIRPALPYRGEEMFDEILVFIKNISAEMIKEIIKNKEIFFD